MASVLVSTLATDLAAEIGVKSTQANYIARVVTWIDEVNKNIYAAKDWYFSRNTTTNIITSVSVTNGQYRISSTADQIVSARIPLTDAKLQYVTIQEMIDSGADLELTGTPSRFFYVGYQQGPVSTSPEGTLIQFWPIPDSTITVSFIINKRGADLTSTSLVPLPKDFIPMLKDGVRELMYQHAGQLQDAQFYGTRYATAMTAKMAKNQFPAHRLRLGESDVPRRPSFDGPKLDPQHFDDN